jgi:hypothetical protein
VVIAQVKALHLWRSLISSSGTSGYGRAAMSLLGQSGRRNCQRKTLMTNCYSKARRVFQLKGLNHEM